MPLPMLSTRYARACKARLAYPRGSLVAKMCFCCFQVVSCPSNVSTILLHAECQAIHLIKLLQRQCSVHSAVFTGQGAHAGLP